MFALGVLVSPLALAEEYIARPITNIPYVVHNAGIGIGEHSARAYLWAEQGETGEAIVEGLETVKSFSEGFVAGASVGVPVAGSVERSVAGATVSTLESRAASVPRPPGLTPQQAANWERAVVEAERRVAAAKSKYGGEGIVNMAISRQQALNRMQGLSTQVERHLAKIAAEPSSQAVAHWRTEIRAWLGEIERLTPNVGKKTGAEWTSKVAEWRRLIGE
jgi:hypothetical protein